jgi:hypothetical protein
MNQVNNRPITTPSNCWRRSFAVPGEDILISKEKDIALITSKLFDFHKRNAAVSSNNVRCIIILVAITPMHSEQFKFGFCYEDSTYYTEVFVNILLATVVSFVKEKMPQANKLLSNN